jgi:hypothetical protein
METDNLRRIDQTGPIIHSNDSDEAHLSITESSEQTLSPMTLSASSLLDVAEVGLAAVDILKLMTAKVLNKRSSSSGVEYKCELEPLWLAADLVERVQMGHVHIRSYENGLIREERLKTLRAGKSKRKLP